MTTNAKDRPTDVTAAADTVCMNTTRRSTANGDDALNCEDLTFSNEAFYCEDSTNLEMTTDQSKSDSVSVKKSLEYLIPRLIGLLAFCTISVLG